MLALELSTPLKRRRVINNEHFPFPVHRREWSMEAKETLRAVTERNAEAKIRLWRMRRSVNRLAYASDGPILDWPTYFLFPDGLAYSVVTE
jgi:hypothetical protein